MSTARLEEMMAESGLEPDEAVELAMALAPLAQISDLAPAPSGALAALFDESPHADPRALLVAGLRRGRARAQTALAGAVVVACSTVGATGLSAAANTLPSPVQHQVSKFSRNYLPFDFPEPVQRREAPSDDLAGAQHAPVEPPRTLVEPSRAASSRPLAANGPRLHHRTTGASGQVLTGSGSGPTVSPQSRAVPTYPTPSSTDDPSPSTPGASASEAAKPRTATASATPHNRPTGSPTTEPKTPLKGAAPSKDKTPTQHTGNGRPGTSTGGVGTGGSGTGVVVGGGTGSVPGTGQGGTDPGGATDPPPLGPVQTDPPKGEVVPGLDLPFLP